MTTTPTEPTVPGSGAGGGSGSGSDSGSGSGSGSGGDQGPRVSRDEARDLSRLRRTRKESLEGRHVAGVGGGIARHLDIDPIVIRVALVVLVFFGGAGLLLYAVGWLVLPEEGTDRSVIRLDPRSRTFVLYVALGLSILAILSDTVGSSNLPWPVGFVAFVVIVILVLKDRAWPSLHRHRDDWTPPPPQEQVDVTAQRPADPTQAGVPGAPPLPPTAPAGPPPAPAPRPPRKRGPRLFWPTIALVVLALGILGIVDGAGADVAGSAYPALALGLIGAALLLGAFWGRAGGLILAGLLALVALIANTSAEVWDVEGDHVSATPTMAVQLAPRYHFHVGEAKIDLRDVQDLTGLDGRTLTITGDVGRIQVIVPDGLTVRAHGDINGPGHIQLFDDDRGGVDTQFDATRLGSSTDSPTLTIESTLGVGEIRIVDADSHFAMPHPRVRLGRN